MKLDVDSITNENAAALLERGLAAVRDGDVTFDLSGVGAVDSAAVALLLAWQREAAARGTRLVLTGVPEGLAGLAQLYGVQSLLGEAAAAP
jgi:phospholipid transport system transporter-binding protein